MSRSSSPEMSVIIATPDSYETIRKTIRYLKAQTAKDRLEIVIVAPSQDGLGLIESDLTGFHSYKVVEAGEIRAIVKSGV